MLGRPLEISLHATDTAASFNFYQRLGFAEATVGDMWPHAYGVMCSADLALGLHGVARCPLVITFVQPDVTRLHREFEALGIAVDRAVLGSDDFNFLELADPAGTALRVIEARSFSLPSVTPAHTLAGSFQQLSLPAFDPSRVQDFWLRLGFDASWRLNWHHPAEQSGPVLMFRHSDPEAVADRLEGRGFDLEERPFATDEDATLHLRTPENLLLIVQA